MVWSIHRQQQQCGVQMPPRADGDRQLGEVPAEAVADRAAQDHEQAGEAAPPEAGYPASPIERSDQDNTPSAPEPRVAWDDVVQPQRQQRGERADEAADDFPPTEGN